MKARKGNRLFHCAAVLLSAGALFLCAFPSVVTALPIPPHVEGFGDPDHPSSTTEQRNNAPGQPPDEQNRQAQAGRRAVVAHGQPSTPVLPNWFVVRSATLSLVRTVLPAINF